MVTEHEAIHVHSIANCEGTGRPRFIVVLVYGRIASFRKWVMLESALERRCQRRI